MVETALLLHETLRLIYRSAQCQAGRRLPTVAAHLPGCPCGSATAEKRGGVDGIFMGFFLDFHGISMGLWYFYGIYEAFMGL